MVDVHILSHLCKLTYYACNLLCVAKIQKEKEKEKINK